MKKFRSVFAFVAVLVCIVHAYAGKFIMHDMAGAWKWTDSTGEKVVVFLKTGDGECDYMIRKGNSLKPQDSGRSWIDEKNTLTMNTITDEKIEKSVSYIINAKLSDNEYLLGASGGESITIRRFDDRMLAAEFVNSARILIRKMEYSEALEIAGKAVQVDPGSKEGWMLQGDAFAGMKDYYQSAEKYRKVLEIDRENREAQKKLEKISKIISEQESGYDGP